MTRLSIVGVVLALLASAGSARAQDQDPCTNTFGELCGCDGGGVLCGSTCDVRTDACCANVATCDPSSTEEGSREACSTCDGAGFRIELIDRGVGEIVVSGGLVNKFKYFTYEVCICQGDGAIGDTSPPALQCDTDPADPAINDCDWYPGDEPPLNELCCSGAATATLPTIGNPNNPRGYNRFGLSNSHLCIVELLNCCPQYTVEGMLPDPNAVVIPGDFCDYRITSDDVGLDCEAGPTNSASDCGLSCGASQAVLKCNTLDNGENACYRYTVSIVDNSDKVVSNGFATIATKGSTCCTASCASGPTCAEGGVTPDDCAPECTEDVECTCNAGVCGPAPSSVPYVARAAGGSTGRASSARGSSP